MQKKRGQRVPVQRPIILDVLPAGTAPRLDVLPMPWRKRLVQKLPRWARHWWMLVAVPAVIVAVVLAVWRPWQPHPVALPKDATSQITDFIPYFYSGKIPQNFTLTAGDVSFSSDVLFLELHDSSGDSVVISEQQLPAEFANEKPQGDQNVSGAQGFGSISSRDNRIVGTLFTSKTPRALITINANDTVPAGTIKSLMTALKPIR